MKKEEVENKGKKLDGNYSKNNFEELMDKLEEITELLESDKLNLDESMEKFEEGMKISKACNEKLELAEKKINILLEENGELKEDNFETEG